MPVCIISRLQKRNAPPTLFAAALRVLVWRDDLCDDDVLACRAVCRDTRDVANPEEAHARRAYRALSRSPSAKYSDEWGERLTTLLYLRTPADPAFKLTVRRVDGGETGALHWTLGTQKRVFGKEDSTRWLLAFFRLGWRVSGWAKAYERRHLFFGLGRAGSTFPAGFYKDVNRRAGDACTCCICV